MCRFGKFSNGLSDFLESFEEFLCLTNLFSKGVESEHICSAVQSHILILYAFTWRTNGLKLTSCLFLVFSGLLGMLLLKTGT